MVDQILQQLSDERKALLKDDQRTQSIPKEPHPRATPQTKTELTRDDKLQAPSPSTPTVAAKETRVEAPKAAAAPAPAAAAPAAKPAAAAAPAAKAAEESGDKNAD